MFLILSLQFLGLAAFANSYLNHIPEAVFSGMVLYMGVVALFGVQMVERFFLMFMAPGQHPDISYLKNVSIILIPLQFRRSLNKSLLYNLTRLKR